MTVTWRSAISYALTVVLLSWLTGALVDLAWYAASADLRGWVSFWLKDPWNAAFPTAAATSLTPARRLLPALPRRRAVLVGGSIHLAVLLLCSGRSSWTAGDEAPADSAFVMAAFAMLTLQLPAAWLLCAWRTGRLEVVLTRPGSAALR
ncbi:hypothetical protein [Streptomyces sp. JNUCC 63]